MDLHAVRALKGYRAVLALMKGLGALSHGLLQPR